MSSSSTTTDMSRLNGLIARLILDELSSQQRSSETPQSLFDRENIREILRYYNQTITNYNNNITIYNQNMERILHLIETSDARAHAHSHSQRETNMPYSTLRRETATTYTDFSGNSVPQTPSATRASYVDASLNSVLSSSRSSYMDNSGNSVSRSNITPYFHLFRTSPYTNIINNLFSATNTQTSYNQFYNQLTENQIREYTSELVYDSSNAELPSRCPISLNDFTNGESILQIRRCKHAFRPNDIRQWLTRHTTCPVCRQDIRGIARATFPNLSDAINTQQDGSDTTRREDTTEDSDYSDMPPLIDENGNTHPAGITQYDSDTESDSIGFTTYNNGYTYVFEFPIQIQDISHDERDDDNSMPNE